MRGKQRRSYQISPIVFNGQIYTEVIIDPHYELRHRAKINDDLILSLVILLSGCFESGVDRKEDHTYFVKKIELDNKLFRLIWLTEKDKSYIGVVNAFRDRTGEKSWPSLTKKN